ncbi:MAG: 3-dehydroquinate synthase family protein [Chlamydia sp.]
MSLSATIFIRRSLSDLADCMQKSLFEEPKRAFICIDSTIPILFQEMLFSLFYHQFSTVVIYSVEGGEKVKTLEALQKITKKAIEEKINSSWSLFGIGGGSLLDLVGFFATVYHRGGFSYCAIPTTLLAMTDASIGGKNGINIDGIKNVLGTLSHPEKILITPEFLQYFTPRELLISSIEMWKHALLTSSEAEIEFKQALDILINRGAAIDEILLPEIAKSVKRKLRFIEDSKMTRDFLNLGHTIGHALESALNQQISHGVAVLYGIYIETLIGVRKGVTIAIELIERERAFVHWMELHVDFSSLQGLFQSQLFIDSMMRDKKNRGTVYPHIVLLEDFGRLYWTDTGGHLLELTYDDILWSIDWIQGNCIWI